MNIYVYSDESGVFDYINQDHFVFAGLIFLDKQTRDIETRKYLNAERIIRSNYKVLYKSKELKATVLKNKHKGKLFRSLNSCIKFAVIIDLKRVHRNIFNDKKTKQRYLDYAFKIGVKRSFEELIILGKIDVNKVKNINFYCDEHTTATNGLYELRDGLEEEFKRGTYNFEYSKFFPPLFQKMNSVNVQYCNSDKQALIRGSDIVANRVYFYQKNHQCTELEKKIHFTYLP